MSNEQLYERVDPAYRGNAFGTFERIRSPKRRRANYGRRRGKNPRSVNGIHRRRRRKLAW